MTADAPLIGISVSALSSPALEALYLAVRPTYSHAVEIAGGAPVLIPLQVGQAGLRRIYERLDAIVLSGGGDIDPARYGAPTTSPHTSQVDPQRDEVEIQLARWAVEDDKPLLAICRGMQVLNVALGGTLIQHIPDEVAGALPHQTRSDEAFGHLAHEVTVTPDSKLYAALNLNGSHLSVNSLHHQAVAKIGRGLRIVARAGDGIVEGVEVPDRRFIIGVQWHPEALVNRHPPMRHLFEALVAAARK